MRTKRVLGAAVPLVVVLAGLGVGPGQAATGPSAGAVPAGPVSC